MSRIRLSHLHFPLLVLDFLAPLLELELDSVELRVDVLLLRVGGREPSAQHNLFTLSRVAEPKIFFFRLRL